MPQQLTSRRGAHQHPTGRSGLRVWLDRDRDGIACED
ncbi:excalibur calcium-binding domain-containing protein [Mycobacterium sp.]